MSNQSIIKKKLGKYFVDQLSPFLTARTIQVVLIRQVLDYTILRTEDSRELNTVELPSNLNTTESEVYGLFLASKQKAVESRKYMEILRTFSDINCFLPRNLCMKCPRCVLFGAVKTKGKYNIRHRVEYSSAYSIQNFDDINEIMTFNAVDEQDQRTGQALGISHNFKPLSLFPSIVTLKSVTYEEFILFLKTILSCTSYGAETRIKGDCRNEILGIIGGFEEIMTPLELKLELNTVLNGEENATFNQILDHLDGVFKKYKQKASTPNSITVISGEDVNKLIEEMQQVELNKTLIDSLQAQADALIEKVTE
ncbi:MAG: type I-D CRISPR-associated protein Cas7/Csc2 [Candidatus Lokiarchaeota archaeon]|nr:type I-D CRISPR-associated protein Cas7/Csc2 [Candidatus Lokiarchaeota archaeon]